MILVRNLFHSLLVKRVIDCPCEVEAMLMRTINIMI